MRIVLRRNSRLRKSLIARASLSIVLRTTLPTKPSATQTSISPLNRSCPSTLPMKFTSGFFASSSCVAFVAALPFSGSVPMESSPTRGFSRPRTAPA